MLSEEKSHLETSLRDSQYYFNRELSWLEFNYRVLHEALLFPGLEIQGFESSILLMRVFHCDEQINDLAYWFS